MGLQPNIARKRNFALKQCAKCGASQTPDAFAPTKSIFTMMAPFQFVIVVLKIIWTSMTMTGNLWTSCANGQTFLLFPENGKDCQK